MAYLHRTSALVQQCVHPLCQAFVMVFAMLLQQCCGDVRAVVVQAETVLKLGQQHALPLFEALRLAFRAWVLTVQQQTATGIAYIRQGMAAYRATDAEVSRPYLLGLLPAAYGHHRRADLGLEVLAEVHATGERFYEAKLPRLQGELLLHVEGGVQYAAVTAEACFQQALQMARAQQAKVLALRAAMRLSRLWQRQGKPGPAQRLPGDVYDWFTEGFESRDRQEARDLLDAIGSHGV
jgi:predicted ATPase